MLVYRQFMQVYPQPRPAARGKFKNRLYARGKEAVSAVPLLFIALDPITEVIPPRRPS